MSAVRASKVCTRRAHSGLIGIAVVMTLFALSSALLISALYLEHGLQFSARYQSLVRHEAALLDAVLAGNSESASSRMMGRLSCRKHHLIDSLTASGIELCGLQVGSDVSSLGILDGLALPADQLFPLLEFSTKLPRQSCPARAPAKTLSEASAWSLNTCGQEQLVVSGSLEVGGNLELKRLIVSCPKRCRLQVLGAASIQQLIVESTEFDLLAAGDLQLAQIQSRPALSALVRLASATGSLRVDTSQGTALAGIAWSGVLFPETVSLGSLTGIALPQEQVWARN
jgi:hypothetical protein